MLKPKRRIVNLKLVANIIGYLGYLQAIVLLAPFVLAHFRGEDISRLAFAFTILTSFGVGLIGSFLKPDDKIIGIRESTLSVVGSWLFFGLSGALPLWLALPISYSQAFFESLSGITTTGATLLSNLDSLDHSLLLWRSMTQWMGGMGIIMLSLAILPLLGASGTFLYKAEVAGPTKDKMLPKMRSIALSLWAIYLGITLVGIIGYRLGGMTLFDSVCYSFGTVATGGFGTHDNSAAGFSVATQWFMIFLMFVSGMNFALHYKTIMGGRKGFKETFKDPELRTYFNIVVILSGAITLVLWLASGAEGEEGLRAATFQVVSLLTTSGYITQDYELWPSFAQGLLFLTFFIGGSGGSTSGGVKVIRMMILFKSALMELKKLVHPRAVLHLKIGGAAIKEDVQSRVVAFFFLYIILFGFLTLIMTAFGLDLFSAFSAVLATMSGVGPGFLGVGPANNYAFIPEGGLWVLSAAMLLGRLELFTLLLVLTPDFWKK
jgi:trk system potassium uptake protein